MKLIGFVRTHETSVVCVHVHFHAISLGLMLDLYRLYGKAVILGYIMSF
jgi:hypothetical protein